MRPSRSPESPSGPGVLVPQTSFLGDVVLTTPLIAALRQRLRPRRLAVLVRPDAAPLATRLRREGFDLAVCPHRSLRTAIVLAASRIPRRVGFADSRGAFLYHE